MITKNKFRIGDVVLVKGEAVVAREREGRFGYYRKVNRRELPEAARYRAVISGVGALCEGVCSYFGPEDGSSFKTKKVVQVWFVRPSVCSKERAVFEEDLELVTPHVRYEHPLADQEPRPRWRGPVPWKLSGGLMTESMRQEMRDIMADWPRDEKGHWKKMPTAGQSFNLWLKNQTDDPEIGELAREAKEGSWSFYDLAALRARIKTHVTPRFDPMAVRAWHRWFEEKGEV